MQAATLEILRILAFCAGRDAHTDEVKAFVSLVLPQGGAPKSKADALFQAIEARCPYNPDPLASEVFTTPSQCLTRGGSFDAGERSALLASALTAAGLAARIECHHHEHGPLCVVVAYLDGERWQILPEEAANTDPEWVASCEVKPFF